MNYIIPRFTSLRVPIDKDEKDVTIQELYSEIVINEMRNQLIIDDVVRSHECGRNCVVLTERTAHVELLTKELGQNDSGCNFCYRCKYMIMWISMYACWRKCIANALPDMLQLAIKQKVRTLQWSR